MKVGAEVEIVNKYGFHVRPSTAFVKATMLYKSKITVQVRGGAVVDGRNIMMLMTLGASKGMHITITADGDDAEAALAALTELVNSRFGGID